MEKLLKLINEYEESRWELIDDGITKEDEENWVIFQEETPLWREYEGHLRHCNASIIAFEKATFDAYALSHRYGFVKRLFTNNKLNKREGDTYRELMRDMSISDRPVKFLISLLK